MLLPLQFVSTFVLACAVSCIVTYAVRWIAQRYGIVDVPNTDRKIHTQPIPLLGGISLYVTVTVLIILLLSWGWMRDSRVPLNLLLGISIAGAVIMIGGFFDDRYRLSWKGQLAFPLIASCIMLIAGLRMGYVTNPFGGGLWYLQEGAGEYIGMVFLLVWMMGMMYTTKLLDGIDGLATSVSCVGSMVLFVVSLFWDRSGSTTSFLALMLAGACAGFLVWNWHPARIFLGEGGSVYVGFMLSVLAVISGGKIATALLIMGVPILDVLWIIVRRLRTTGKVHQGDAEHLHFRLLHAGFNQRQVVVFLSLVSLAFGSVSFFFTTRAKLIALAALVLFMIGLARYVVTHHETIPSSH